MPDWIDDLRSVRPWMKTRMKIRAKCRRIAARERLVRTELIRAMEADSGTTDSRKWTGR